MVVRVSTINHYGSIVSPKGRTNSDEGTTNSDDFLTYHPLGGELTKYIFHRMD